DFAIGARVLESGILERHRNVAVDKEDRAQTELGAEAYRKPDTFLKAPVFYIESQAGNVGAQQGANPEGNLARQFRVNREGLVLFLVDQRLARPSELTLVRWAKLDSINLTAFQGVFSRQLQAVFLLLLRCQGEKVCRQGVFRL